MRNLFMILFLLTCSLFATAQNVELRGMVISGTDKQSLPGVNIIVKGTANGTITDENGRFSMPVPLKSTIIISYIGYNAKEITVEDAKPMTIVLDEDTENLEEVVVIGYGTQKKSVVTASIAKVSTDDLKNVAPVRVDNALKGLAAGVMVTSASGQPGDAAKVRVRGFGTINDNDPLFIIDGMPVDVDGIDYLNPSDILSIEVLKDAASAAIYGTRGANGVILVTTKSGKEGKAKVSYDFSYSIQNPWKEREVLNASEYALMINEGLQNAGKAAIYNDPYSYGKGTNWQKELFNNDAPMMSHQLSISGGSEKLTYYISAAYFTQDGIIGGNFDRSNYERFSIRSNNQYKLFDESSSRNWLNKMNINVNASYSRIKSKNVSTNSEFGSPLGSALTLSPILSVYAQDEAAELTPYQGLEDFTPVRDSNGRLYTIAGSDYNEITNPLAALSLPGTEYGTDKLVANLSAELNIWDNLKFKTSLGTDLAFWGNDGYVKKYYLTSTNKATDSKVYSEMNRGFTWQIENTFSYEKSFDKHNFSAVVGQSASKYEGRQLGGANLGMIEEDGSKANINFTNGLQENGTMSIYGGAAEPHTMSSYFGRISYNYDERYILQATVRNDGSSRFGANNHFVTLPSVSLGWNLTNEKFMEKRPSWLSSAKVRLSWGKNGNESIGNFKYIALTATGNNYIFGKGENLTNGTKPSTIPNPDLAWEESEQTDLGIDLGFFNNALTFTADYYVKNTDGMLTEMVIPSYVGETKPYGNVGEMKNSGIELEAAYRFKVSDWNFRVSGNASYLKNELIDYGNDTGYANLDSNQGIGTISRAQNGEPYPFFYGYKTAGIFQNMQEVKDYTFTNAAGETSQIQPSALPGDVRFVDINKDGVIDDNDRTKIGKGAPDWTFGFSFNADWKGFDFKMLWQGTSGNDIFDATRRTDITYSNLPEYMLNRWTGEGTSNKIPRFVIGDNVNWQSSDLLVKDGSYLRLKNIELGYTLPSNLTKKAFISSLRIYVAAENLLTFTKYDGFDPEISSGGTSLGIDKGVYPQAKVYTIGLNLNF